MMNLWHSCPQWHTKPCHPAHVALPVCLPGFWHTRTHDNQLSFVCVAIPKTGVRMRASQLIVKVIAPASWCAPASWSSHSFPECDHFTHVAVPKIALHIRAGQQIVEVPKRFTITALSNLMSHAARQNKKNQSTQMFSYPKVILTAMASFKAK